MVRIIIFLVGMGMRKRGSIVTLLIVVSLVVGVYTIVHFQGNDRVQGDLSVEKQEKSTTQEEKEPKNDPSEKVEEMADEELKELIIKGRKANQGEVEVTPEETEMLKNVPPKKYYALMGMTDDEVLGYIDNYHQTIDRQIMLFHEGGNDEKCLPGEAEFKWIEENYDFEKDDQKESIKEILDLRADYMEGNQDALFSLKRILYDLNEELNPESLKEERDNNFILTLDDSVRIHIGEDPINYE